MNQQPLTLEVDPEEHGWEYHYPQPPDCQIVEPPTDDAPAPYDASAGSVWDGEGP